jgi:hypothetical protein
MRRPSTTRVLVNPRPQAVRLVLSDGSVRLVPPWGLTVVPRADDEGRQIEVLEAMLIERRSVPGTDQAAS